MKRGIDVFIKLTITQGETKVTTCQTKESIGSVLRMLNSAVINETTDEQTKKLLEKAEIYQGYPGTGKTTEIKRIVKEN